MKSDNIEDNAMFLLNELVFMIHKPRKYDISFDTSLVNQIIAHNSKLSNRTALYAIGYLLEHNFIRIDKSYGIKHYYVITIKGWDYIEYKNYCLIQEHIYGIDVSLWIRIKRFFTR